MSTWDFTAIEVFGRDSGWYRRGMRHHHPVAGLTRAGAGAMLRIGRPPCGAKGRSVEDRTVDVDKAVTDAVFDGSQVGGSEVPDREAR